MKAVKGNKEYTIEESEKKSYQNAGFDIVDGGKVVAYGRGKTVPYEDYAKLQEEVRELTATVEKLKAALKKDAKKADGKAGE